MKPIDTSTLPAPLTPPDCDLRDFQFIPVDVHRLLTSETWILGTGDERAAAMTLWLASWHQVPAGSIPKDDRMLAHLSQSGAKWKKLKAHSLRGWIEAADGRLYHPVVAEKALEAWVEKLAYSLSGSAGNAKRWGVSIETDSTRDRAVMAISMLRSLAPQSKALKKKAVAVIESGSRPESGGDDKASGGDGENLSGGDDKTSGGESGGDRKGQGQGEGQGKLTSNPESSSQASTGVGADQQRDDDDQARKIQRSTSIAALLSESGIEGTPDHAIVRSWAADPRMNRDLLTEAITKARKSNSKRPMPLTYLEATVLTLLERQSTPPRAPAVPTSSPPISVPAARKPQGLDPKGIDESIEHYNARIAAAEAAQRRGQQP